MLTASLPVSRGFVPRERTDFLESSLGAIPRGALTEISGPASSGRTAFLCSLMAAVTSSGEFCALIDVDDAFDPASAAAAGVCLPRVLWVRCGGSIDHAIRAADLLAQAGGFGLVAIDLGNAPVKLVHRLPLAVWFRLRHAVQNTRTALVSMAQRVHAHSCSELKIQLSRDRAMWRGKLPGRIFAGFHATAQCTKNHRVRQSSLEISGEISR
jgi:recombination protein RecA